MRTSLASILLLAALCGCEAPSVPSGHSAAGVTAPAVAEIDWFEGGVDAAFAYAKAARKPLFLYWGASWCPPCHYIHEVIFADPEFVARSRLFVPVALDGDREGAQQLGERLGVLGYPTMIVYDPDGREITRIPGGIDMTAYANVLDIALAGDHPVAELVAGVRERGASLDRKQCELAAYYSWDQDNERVLAGHDAPRLLAQLREACPAGAARARARLYFERLGALSRADGGTEPALGPEAAHELAELFADEPIARDNAYAVLFSGAGFIGASTAPGSEERARLEARYLDLLDHMQRDETLYPSFRLYTLIGKIKLAKLDAGPDAAVPPALVEETRRLVAWADASTSDPYRRQVVMNAAWGALLEAGLDADADRMLEREISKASQPHYFMSGLAEIAQKAGHYEQAIDWLERAYRAADGEATRFQWGTDYVIGLVEMTPEDAPRIEGAAAELFDGLERHAATAFYQRNTQRMARLERALVDWNANGAHSGSIEKVRSRVRTICAEIDAAERAHRVCEAFLAAA